MMKTYKIGWVIFIFTFFLQTSFAIDIKLYLNKKVQELIKSNTKTVGEYTVVAIPIPYKLTLISTYYDYKSRGLSESEIINKLKKEYSEWKKSGIPFVIVFIYRGNNAETGVVVPSSLKEHIYLKNSSGVKGEIKFQKVPIKRALNKNNRKVIINLIFSTVDSQGRYLLDTDKLYLYIKDILPEDLRLSYTYPFIIDFSDAPLEIKRVLNKVSGY